MKSTELTRMTWCAHQEHKYMTPAPVLLIETGRFAHDRARLASGSFPARPAALLRSTRDKLNSHGSPYHAEVGLLVLKLDPGLHKQFTAWATGGARPSPLDVIEATAAWIATKLGEKGEMDYATLSSVAKDVGASLDLVQPRTLVGLWEPVIAAITERERATDARIEREQRANQAARDRFEDTVARAAALGLPEVEAEHERYGSTHGRVSMPVDDYRRLVAELARLRQVAGVPGDAVPTFDGDLALCTGYEARA